MKLTYWIAECLNDSRCYNIRAKTRKAVLEQLRNENFKLVDKGESETYNNKCYRDGYGRSYSVPKKIIVEYEDGFDLICQALSEGGIEY